MDFGKKLYSLRKERGLSQAKVAEAVGISRRAYIGYENDGRRPQRHETYGKLAEFFGVDAGYLFTDDEYFIEKAGESFNEKGRREAAEVVDKANALFAGGDITDHDKDLVMKAIQEAYFEAKTHNKKFIPKKFRFEE